MCDFSSPGDRTSRSAARVVVVDVDVDLGKNACEGAWRAGVFVGCHIEGLACSIRKRWCCRLYVRSNGRIICRWDISHEARATDR